MIYFRTILEYNFFRIIPNITTSKQRFKNSEPFLKKTSNRYITWHGHRYVFIYPNVIDLWSIMIRGVLSFHASLSSRSFVEVVRQQCSYDDHARKTSPIEKFAEDRIVPRSCTLKHCIADSCSKFRSQWGVSPSLLCYAMLCPLSSWKFWRWRLSALTSILRKIARACKDSGVLSWSSSGWSSTQLSTSRRLTTQPRRR